MKTFIKLQAVALAALVACAPALAMDGRLPGILGETGFFDSAVPVIEVVTTPVVVEQVAQPGRLQNVYNAVVNSRVATGASNIAAQGYTKVQNGCTYVAGTKAGILAGKAKDGVVNFAKAGYGKAQQAAAYLGETRAAKFTAQKATQAATKVKGATNTIVDAAKKHPYYAGAIALGAVAAGTAMYLGYKAYQSKAGVKKLSTKPTVVQPVTTASLKGKDLSTVPANKVQIVHTSFSPEQTKTLQNKRPGVNFQYDAKRLKLQRTLNNPKATKEQREAALAELKAAEQQVQQTLAQVAPTPAQKVEQGVKSLGRKCKNTACNVGSACKTGLNKTAGACKTACNKVRNKVSFR